MYISRYLYVSTQLLLAGADDGPHHHRPEAALVDVPRHWVVIMFRLSIRRSGWPPPSAHRVSSICHPHHQTRQRTGCIATASLATNNRAYH